MTAEALASRAALLADATRATMCVALLDGRAWTAGELAHHAAVAPSTATGHLSRLVDGGLLEEMRQGRHRYLRLAGPDVAHLIEDLAGPPAPPVGLRQTRRAHRLAAGRTCYDHLAGDLGVGIYHAMVRLELLNAAGLTDAGRSWYRQLLGPQCLTPRGTRPLFRTCLDWTARTSHLGGTLGSDLCTHLFDTGWTRRPAGDRAVEVTPTGYRELRSRLGVELSYREPPLQSSGAARGVSPVGHR